MTRIGFSTPKRFNPFSWAIRRITGSEASHAWFTYHDRDWDLPMVLDAHETGFRLITLDAFRARNKIVAIVATKQDLDPGLRQAALWLGSRYDFAGLIGMVVVLVGRWFKRRWRNPFRSSRSVFCSESVVRVLREVKYPGAENLDPESTTPQDLMEFLLLAEGGDGQRATDAATV